MGETSKPFENIFDIDVASYEAVGDDQKDDTPTFQKAWIAVCSSYELATLLVPKENTYLVKRIMFSTKSNSSITFRLKGKLIAPTRSCWPADTKTDSV